MSDHFFSCDWGTSFFRLRLATISTGEVVAGMASPDGIKSVLQRLPKGARTEERAAVFAEVLRARLDELRGQSSSLAGNCPVLISGMASSSVGWRELSYAPVPFPVDGSGARIERLAFSDSQGREVPVWLVSGAATEADILRGEETEVIGILAGERYGSFREDCLLILPGTHSKQIRIQAGAVRDFHTFMTGELFEVLCRHSLLRVSVMPASEAEGSSSSLPLDELAFREGVDWVRRAGLARSLFQVRARSVLRRVAAPANRSFLSGLLVGGELLDGCSGDDSLRILLAATGSLARSYRLAGDELGLSERLTVVEEELVRRAVVLGHLRLLRRARERTES